eukprot:5799315-Lingulodinium_polyedra.AAC.1
MGQRRAFPTTNVRGITLAPLRGELQLRRVGATGAGGPKPNGACALSAPGAADPQTTNGHSPKIRAK